MSATIYAKSLRDRWVSTTVASVSLGLWLLMAMAVYADIDLSIYTELPEALRSVMGIPDGADPASLAYNVVFGTLGSLTLAGLALSMGASAIAGEERDGTLGLLLANPVSRTRVLVSKATSIVTLVVAIVVVLWGAGHLVPAVLDVEIGTTHLGAMALHLAANALLYGFVALAIGAWTGNRSLASAATTTVMVLSFVATGVVPLIDSIAGFVKVVPWYYLDGGDPLVNGVVWGHVAVLVGGAALAGVAAVVGVNRRDLRGQATATTLMDRLRDHPATQRLAERLAGGTRVSAIWTKTATEHQGIVVITAGLMFGFMGVLMGPMYTFMDTAIAGMSTDFFPEEVIALVGGGDLKTPTGFYQIETFGLMAPIATILVAVAVAAKALAGEEARNTMGLLLANPVPRWRVVLEKSLTMALLTSIVGVATFGGVAVGVLIAGLDVSIPNVAAISVLVTLVGLVFGGLALAISAGTGRTGLAVYATVGAALTFHVANAYLPFSDQLAGWARLSPFYYYLGSDPLNQGMHWGHAAVLTVLAIGLVGLAVALFERRDLRQS